MSERLRPTTISEIDAYKAGQKHHAERNVHQIGGFDGVKEIPEYKNPYKKLTLEYYYFNQGYLGTKYEIKEVKDV